MSTSNSNKSSSSTSTGTTQVDTQGTVPTCCTSPEEVFMIANSLAALFAANFTQLQLQTIINMLVLLEAALSVIVTQQQLCEGVIVQPPE